MSDNKFVKVKDSEIILERGKKYILCISPDIPNILPIIKLFKNHNPILISAGEHLDIQENDFICLRKEPFFSVKELVEELLHSKTVSNLIGALRVHQGAIWVKTWCNHRLFQPFFDKPEIKSLGFSPNDAQWMNNKLFQYELLKDIVPIADFIIDDKKCCLNHFEEFETEKGVITILAFGGAGSGVKIHATKKDLDTYFEKIDDEKLILARIIKKKASPSIDIIVANEKEIIAFGLAEQIFNGLQCLGATYPTILNDKTKNKCYELAKTVGREIAKKGIRGYFGIDIIVDENNNVFFSEINGRYAGTTANRLLAMEQSRPQNHPSILDLEVMAIRDGTFHGHNLWNEPQDIFWYKRILRSKYDGVINNLNISNDVQKIFADYEGIALVGQLNPGDKVIKNKTELGNLMIVKKTRESLNDSIGQVNNLLNNYVKIIEDQKWK